jgi:hypothetical protein
MIANRLQGGLLMHEETAKAPIAFLPLREQRRHVCP